MRLQQLILLTLFLIFQTSALSGQDMENEGVFAFAYDKNGKYTSPKEIPGHKYATATKVFNKLVEAKGVKNMPKPQFLMDNAERRPAWTKPAEAVVVLEEKAFDLCIQSGSDSLNALAAILSHELIHYYEKHDWKEHFIGNHSDGELGQLLKPGNDHMELEFQADYMGGLLSHMAGYNTLGVMPSLLSGIYESYRLNQYSSGTYPSLEERRAIAHNSDIQLTKYSRLFEMSLYLAASGQYGLARNYLEFVLVNTQFQSREIYNNLGVLSTIMAIDRVPATELIYRLPVELELSTRMNTRSGEDEELQSLLADAEYNFKNAMLLDAEFSAAYLNLATIYTLKNDFFDAEYYARKALKAFENAGNAVGQSDAANVLGVIAAQKGEAALARDLFLQANNSMGRTNLCLLEKRNNCIPDQSEEKPYYLGEVDDVNLERLYTRIMQDKEQAALSIDLDAFNSFHTIAKPHSEILVNLNHRHLGDYVFFQIVKDPKVVYGGNVKTGMNSAALVKSLGRPTLEFNSWDKSIWVYRSKQVLFKLDADHTIVEWCVYKSNKK